MCFTALINGIPKASPPPVKDLQDPANYQVVPSILDNPLTNQLIRSAHTMGFTDATDLSSMLKHPSRCSEWRERR